MPVKVIINGCRYGLAPVVIGFVMKIMVIKSQYHYYFYKSKLGDITYLIQIPLGRVTNFFGVLEAWNMEIRSM